MVTALRNSLTIVESVAVFAAQAANDEPQLDPATRTAALLLLVGIGLVGVLFTAAVLLGGSWVRRQGRHRRAAAVPPDRAPIRTPPPENEPATDDESA